MNKQSTNNEAIEVFDTLLCELNGEYATLQQAANSDANAKYKSDLFESILAEMNLAKSQHDKDSKDLQSKNATVENTACNYTSSIAAICASLNNSGDLSELVENNLRYQLMVLLYVDESCKQDELIQLIQELSVIVKDVDSFKEILQDPDKVKSDKCNREDETVCQDLLAEGISCDVLKTLIAGLQNRSEELQLLDMVKLDALLAGVINCDDEQKALADAKNKMNETTSDYLCAKGGCSTGTSNLPKAKMALEKLLQAIQGLAGNAKKQADTTYTYMAAFTSAFEARRVAEALLQLHYFVLSRQSLINEICIVEDALTNDAYETSDVFACFGAGECSQVNTADMIMNSWEKSKQTYVKALNELYVKETELFTRKKHWAEAATSHNECSSKFLVNAIKAIQDEISKQTENSGNGDTGSGCKDPEDPEDTEPAA